MIRRGAVGIHELWNRPSQEIIGFDVTFADGHKMRHKGGCVTIPQRLISEHGEVISAKRRAKC